MKFTIDIAKAKTSLEASTVVLNANTAQQEVLKNFLIQADDAGVLITGTDLEISLVDRQTAKVEEPGQILVSGKKLSDIIRYASGEKLTFATADDKLTISSATGKWVLLTRSTEEYPNVENFDDSKPSTKLNRQQFIAALNRVLFSVCEDETRRALNAVSINNDRFISTDGKMISIFTSPIKLGLEDVIIPQRSIAPLIRVLSKFETETFDFQNQAEQPFMYFKIADTVFSIRKVTIKFPESRLSKLVSDTKENNTVKAKFNRTAMIGAIERVRLNANEDSRAIYFCFEKNSCVLKTQDEFGNYSVEKIPASLDSQDTDKVEVFYNWLNILDCLKAMNGEGVDARFAVKSPNKSPMYIGESTIDAVILPIETAFQADILK